jgi:hypothetical protein
LVVVEKDLPDMVRLSICNGEFTGELKATNYAFLYECLDVVPAATYLLDDFEVTGDTTLTALLRSLGVYSTNRNLLPTNTRSRHTNRFLGTYTSRQSPLQAAFLAQTTVDGDFFPEKVAFLEPAEEDGDFFTRKGGFLEPADEDEDFFMEDRDIFTVAASFLAATAEGGEFFMRTAAFLKP